MGLGRQIWNKEAVQPETVTQEERTVGLASVMGLSSGGAL